MRSALEWAQVRALAADGVPEREIARRLGMNRRTICAAITERGGPALLDVIITVRRQNGGEWLFLTHRSPGFRPAVPALNDRT